MASHRPLPLVGRLKTAVQKLKFLLSFSPTRWLFSSLSGSPPSGQHRQITFEGSPGLLDIIDDNISPASSGPSRINSSSSRSVISRTSSSRSTSSTEDIDKRAEIFIANFYKHIQMERQVSLQLRYCKQREGSLDRTLSG